MTSTIDLSRLPSPDVVETIDFESIRSAMIDDLIARYPEFSEQVESEPAIKVIEVAAYRETVLRQRINGAAQAVMLPYAMGSDLDNLAALFEVERLVTRPADPDATPPVPARYETDSELRRRVQLSLEGLSVAGPPGAYEFHALSADGQVLDASVDAPTFSDGELLDDGRIAWTVAYDAGLDTPRPGDVVVSVLSRDGDGTPSGELLDAVHDALYADNVRPLTDHPIIRAAEIVNYTVEATLYVYEGPDSSIVLDDAREAIAAHVADIHRLGYDVSLSGLYAALHRPGVQRVELISPAEGITISARAAPYCTAIDIQFGGRDE